MLLVVVAEKFHLSVGKRGVVVGNEVNLTTLKVILEFVGVRDGGGPRLLQPAFKVGLSFGWYSACCPQLVLLHKHLNTGAESVVLLPGLLELRIARLQPLTGDLHILCDIVPLWHQAVNTSSGRGSGTATSARSPVRASWAAAQAVQNEQPKIPQPPNVQDERWFSVT